MSNEIKVLDNTLLTQLWQKSLNTFALRQEMYNNPKALYNLGVYDTYVDNNDGTITITRQTGYVDLGKLTYSLSQDSNYWYWEASFSKSQYYSANTQTQCSHPIYQAVRYNNADFNTNNRIAYSNATMVVRTSSTSELPKGLLQFKLASSYTETVIKNQTLNTLNQKGSQWLASEYEKTINLFNINDLNFGTYLTKSGNSFTLNANYGYPNSIFKNAYTFKANTQYTFAYKRTGDSGNVRVDIKYSDGSLQELALESDNEVVVSTAGKTITDLICDYSSGGSTTYTDFMIVEGTHAYPYQPYNGAIVHQVDLVDYLKVIYPVGSIYITMGTKSPAELFGGTWTPIEYKFLYSTYELNELGQTLGSASHSHLLPIGYEGNNEWFYSDYLTGDGNTHGIRGIHDDYTSITGSVAYRYESSSASSFPPCIKVCAYKRIA